jgi:soluble P-type ATPase
VALGNQALLNELDIEPGPLAAQAEGLRGSGQTVMFVAVNRVPVGVLGVADPVKDTTPEAVESLHGEGVRIVMLTGDSRTTAEAVGRELGIDDVVAEVLPDQKAQVVQRLQKEGRIVAMAGDGINDAWHRTGAAVEPCDDAEHSTEPVLRIRLQQPRRSGGCRRTLPGLRTAPESDDSRSRDELQFGFRDWERAAIASR